MTDLQIAKTKLHEEELTLVVVKSGEVLFRTRNHRITGFLDAIGELGERLEGASLADRVAGKAVAFLCAYARIKSVYASVLSKKAQTVFTQYKISVHWKDLVDNVLNANKTSVCPFEKKAEKMSSSEEAYLAFKNLRDTMGSCT
jgi:hypothetical protein